MMEEKIGEENWKVDDYLKFKGKINGKKRRELKSSIKKALEFVGMEGKREERIKNLSKGERQKLKWAHLIIIEPEVYILDEPTSGLDPLGKLQMREWIKMQNSRGKTFVISTHLIEEFSGTGDNYFILHKGELKVKGKMDKGENLLEIFYKIVKGG